MRSVNLNGNFDEFKCYTVLIGEKVRDQSTGRITHYSINGDVKDKNILIVDDICDGGMTFRILSKSLVDRGSKSNNLYVSHGIFSQGLDVLRNDGINRIFTINGEF